MILDELLRAPLDPSLKGLPDGLKRTFSLGDIAHSGWNLLRGDVPLPAASIDEVALAGNSRWMRAFTEAHHVRLCPHGKTTMAPQLFRRQLDDGAWGITVATTQQLLVCRRFEVPRVLLANQLVDPCDQETVFRAIRDDRNLDFYCLVDSADNLEQLLVIGRRFGASRPLQVLLEVGMAGGRTGCRSRNATLELATRVSECSPVLALRGIEGFEGMCDFTDEKAAREYIADVCGVLRECRQNGLFSGARPILSLGGSIFFDLVATHPAVQSEASNCEIVLRSGCYLTHDSGMLVDNFQRVRARTAAASQVDGFPRPALRVWGVVQSLPEQGLAIVNVGKRDISHDVDLPIVERWFRRGYHRLPVTPPERSIATQINDQHLFLRIDAATQYRIGDLVGLGVSHPCTTFDKWKLLYVTDERLDVTEGILTFF